MVTEHENLKFRYFSFLFITGVIKHNRIHIYLFKAPLKTQFKQVLELRAPFPGRQ